MAVPLAVLQPKHNTMTFLTKIRYFDFLVGSNEQSHTAWQEFPVRIAHTSHESAQTVFCELSGIPSEMVMQIVEYRLKSRNGKTMLQFERTQTHEMYYPNKALKILEERNRELERVGGEKSRKSQKRTF